METKNGYVKWRALGIIVALAMATIGSAVSIAVSAHNKASANEVKIMGVETNESNHYNELKGVVDNFDEKLDRLLMLKQK